MNESDKTGSFELSQQEFSRVENYRRLKETSILVILFTDIKGFTHLTEEKGEQYSQMMRKYHDEILISTIEENNIGLVVKHIGDSVMAVFSEPSSAVAKALEIQEKIREFNESHPDLEKLQVRIGIHMGQVTVENEARLDLFGRHVNRASRVEGLADGGQIYMTYPVFDSARGWLMSKNDANLVWKLHGKFFLKGIDAPVDIYEVLDNRFRKPRPPLNARRKRSFLPVWGGAALVLVGIILTLGFLELKRTEVYLVSWNHENTRIDQKEELILEGKSDQEIRRVINKINAGRHLLQQDINYIVKNYMEIEIKRGKNYLKPNFTANYLPGLSRRLDYTKDNTSVQADGDFTYLLYDKKNNRLDNRAHIDLSIKGRTDPKKKDRVIFTYNWKVVLNDKIISEKELIDQNTINNFDVRNTSDIIYEDACHYWYVRRFISGGSTELEIQAAYIEYKNR